MSVKASDFGRLSMDAKIALEKLPSAELVSVWDEISTLACGDNNNNNFGMDVKDMEMAAEVAKLPKQALENLLKAHKIE